MNVNDGTEPCPHCGAAHYPSAIKAYHQGARETVERIVAWLRAGGENGPSATELFLANAIEAGEWKSVPSPSNPMEKL